MTVEELLKPRTKCIAPYPGSKFELGEVMSTEDFEFWTNGDDPKKYPANFKMLEWWEERSPDQMPDYIKDNGCVYKVRAHHRGVNKDVFRDDLINYPWYYTGKLPATREDYEAYINSKHT